MKKIIGCKKSLILFALFFCASTGVFAQDAIEKGAWVFTGGSNLGYTSVSPDGGTSSSLLNINLKGGYFFMDNLAGGVLFDLYSVNSGSSTSSITTIGAFGRYYVSGKFFLGAGVASQSSSGGGSSSIAIPIEAGYAFFLGKVVAIEPSIKYTKGDGQSTFGFNFGFSVFLGRGE